MDTIAAYAEQARVLLAKYRVQLSLCCRMTLSAVLSLVASHLLHLPIALWTVLTAVLMTQLNVGRSLKTTADYLAGTVGAAVYAAAIGTLLPAANGVLGMATLALAVAPAALLAAINPRFSAAPFTAVLVVLAPTITHLTAVGSALDRVIEVAVGSIIGIGVSLLVLPARAYDLAIDAAAEAIRLMARSLAEALSAIAQGPGGPMWLPVESDIGAAFAKLDAIVLEAKQERMTRLTAEPDQGVLLRTMLRLRHDLVIIGRVAAVPLPDTVHARLGPWVAQVGDTADTFLQTCAAGVAARRAPPPLDDATRALDGFAAELAALRRANATRSMPVDIVERVFTLGFALEQLRRNLSDLARCVAELSAAGPTTGAIATKWSRPS